MVKVLQVHLADQGLMVNQAVKALQANPVDLVMMDDPAIYEILATLLVLVLDLA